MTFCELSNFFQFKVLNIAYFENPWFCLSNVTSSWLCVLWLSDASQVRWIRWQRYWLAGLFWFQGEDPLGCSLVLFSILGEILFNQQWLSMDILCSIDHFHPSSFIAKFLLYLSKHFGIPVTVTLKSRVGIRITSTNLFCL